MRNVYTLGIVLALMSCADPNPDNRGISDPFLMELAEPFYLQFPNVRRDTVIKWTTKTNELFANKAVIAQCLYSDRSLVEIHSKRVYAGDVERLQAIIFHELGHCELGLPHYEAGLDLMNSRLTADFGPKRFELLEDLYHRLFPY